MLSDTTSWLSRRDLWLGGALLSTTVIAQVARPARDPDTGHQARLETAISSRIGPYFRRQADEIILPERDSDSLTVYQQYIARTYEAPGLAPIQLLIAYGAAQDYTLQLHRPESCYPPAGFLLGQNTSVSLATADRPNMNGVTLTARRLNRVDRILYWTRVGDAFPTSLWAQRWITLRQLLLRHMPDGVLVRLSTADDSPDPLENLLSFNQFLLASLGVEASRLLLGANGSHSRL